MIKHLKHPQISALVLTLGIGMLFLLFSFAGDKPVALEYKNDTALVISNPLDADFQPNEMHTYALWHEIHF